MIKVAAHVDAAPIGCHHYTAADSAAGGFLFVHPTAACKRRAKFNIELDQWSSACNESTRACSWCMSKFQARI
jgi:hypothetical protein